jgi:hypothetical protein
MCILAQQLESFQHAGCSADGLAAAQGQPMIPWKTWMGERASLLRKVGGSSSGGGGGGVITATAQ